MDELLSGGTVSTFYQWDLLGRLVGLTDNAGNHWSYTYDSLGRRIAATDPDLGLWAYQYDDAGRLTLQTDALAQRTRLTYDAADRPLTKTARDGTPQAETTTFTYDEPRPGYKNEGQLTTATNAAASILYNYDAEGRLVDQTGSVSGSIYNSSTAYDLGGRPLWITYPDGDNVGSTARRSPTIPPAASRPSRT